MAARKTTKKVPQTDNGIEVNLVPSDELLPNRLYANYVQVAQTPYDFSLKFCDATPISGGNNIEGKITHTIPIVAEITISFDLMPSFIKALQDQYEMYRNRIEREKNAGK